MHHAKTDKGQEALRIQGGPLTRCQRVLLIIANGQYDDEQLLRLTAGVGATREDLAALVAGGYLVAQADAPSEPMPVEPMSAESSADTAPASVQDRFLSAYRLGVALSAQLGLRGFRLNLAMEAAVTLEELRRLLPELEEALTKLHGPEEARARLQAFAAALAD